jgi:hypothetical protein
MRRVLRVIFDFVTMASLLLFLVAALLWLKGESDSMSDPRAERDHAAWWHAARTVGHTRWQHDRPGLPAYSWGFSGVSGYAGSIPTTKEFTSIRWHRTTLEFRLSVFVILFGLLPGAWLVVRGGRRLRRWDRSFNGRCPDCGYDVRATPTRCPECGSALR